jgi:hypothetical protein
MTLTLNAQTHYGEQEDYIVRQRQRLAFAQSELKIITWCYETKRGPINEQNLRFAKDVMRLEWLVTEEGNKWIRYKINKKYNIVHRASIDRAMIKEDKKDWAAFLSRAETKVEWGKLLWPEGST